MIPRSDRYHLVSVAMMILMLGQRSLYLLKQRTRSASFVATAFRVPLSGTRLLVPRATTTTTSSRWRTTTSDAAEQLISASPKKGAAAAHQLRPRIHSIAALSQASSNAASSSDDVVVVRKKVLVAPPPRAAVAPMVPAAKERVAAVVVVDENSPILIGLNPSQVEAVTQPVASVTRVVAGPGSGKTRVLTSRIAWLLQQNGGRDRVLGVTFTKKAAGEMQSRVHKLLLEEQEQQSMTTMSKPDTIEETVGDAKPTPAGLDRVTLGTFHSICAKILRWNGDCLVSLPSVIDDMSKSPVAPVLDGTFNIADQSEQVRLVKEALTEYNINLQPYDLKPLQVLSALSRCKAMLTQGENPFAEENGKKTTVAPVMQVAQKIYYRCREKLLSANSVDFDDLIYLTRELLLVNEGVRERLQRRWNHVLVDEFQDTSQTQMDLIKLLTASSLFVVGDADQSIYSWRGAHAGSLSDFEHEFKKYNADGVSTVYLMENYRSTSNIVKAAQKVISASGRESSGADKLRQEMIPKRSAGPSPRIVACADGQAEAEFVVKKVKEQVSAGEYGTDYSVAFIYRTNAQSRHLEEACVRYNLPYVIFGSATSFYKRQEIKDCLCFLRWLYNGRDRSSMLRAFETPKRGIGDTAIREFDEYCALVDQLWDEHHPEATKPTILEILFHLSGDDSWCNLEGAQFPPPSVSISTRPLKLLVEFSSQMVAFRRLAKVATVDQVLTAIVDDLKLIPHLDKISKSKSEFEERQANVQELQQASRRYTDAGSCLPEDNETMGEDGLTQSPLGNFLDDVALVTDMADRTEGLTEQRFVANLMTIHASKGMEFDTVFFVGIEDGTLPTNQALKEGMDSVVFEEEKRLCYVAMTRAKTELVMSWRQEVPIFTPEGIRTVPRRRSRFLDVLVAKKAGPFHGTVVASKATKTLERKQQTRSANTDAFSTGSVPPPTTRRKYSSVAPVRPSAVPSPPPRTAQTPKKLTGTASVYARKNSPFDTMMEAPRSPKRPPTSTPMPSNAGAPRTESSAPSRPNEALSSRVASQPRSIDSTWFFPVGSKVRHQQLGEGVVLPPLPQGMSVEMAVLVKFRNGEQREFPVETAELSPIVL